MHRVGAQTFVILLMAAFIWMGCEDEQFADDDMTVDDQEQTADRDLPQEQEEFWSNLEEHCGKAYAGEAQDMREDDTRRHDLYQDKPMVAHFRQCLDDELRIPGHIAEDRSRTWLLTKVDGGLDLRHDHREEDGSDSDNTMYGASTVDAGTSLRQEFVREEGSGYWVLELEPGERFIYGNYDGEEWLVRFVFDLNEEVDPPPAPWGYEDTEPTHGDAE